MEWSAHKQAVYPASLGHAFGRTAGDKKCPKQFAQPLNTGCPHLLKYQIKGLSCPNSLNFKDPTHHHLRNRSWSLLQHRFFIKSEAAGFIEAHR